MSLRASLSIVFAALALTACTPLENQSGLEENPSLNAIVQSSDDPVYAVPGAAFAIAVDGQIERSETAGTARFNEDGLTPIMPLASQIRVRVASISKLVPALVADALSRSGQLDLDENVLPILGYDPRGDGLPVSMRQLLAHTSGICDDIYWAPLGASLQDLLAEPSTCGYAPDENWTYANVNYGLAAEVMERVTGERFDELANRLVLEPVGLGARFNWSGMSAMDKAAGGTLYRRIDGVWIAQVDDAQSLNEAGPSILREEGADLDTYQPGTNGTLFSPQGGLRASVEELAILSGLFRSDQVGAALAEPVWTGFVSPGVEMWGTGPQILIEGQVPGRPDLRLVGHSGEAYGLYGGAWSFFDCPVSFAFFVNGTDPNSDQSRDEVTGFTYWETALFHHVLPQAWSYCQRELE